MIEKRKKAVDNKKVFRAIFNDKSKAFDSICYYILGAKLTAYGRSFLTLKLMGISPASRKQKQMNSK